MVVNQFTNFRYNNWKRRPKIPSLTIFFFSTHPIPHQGLHMNHLGTWGPHQTSQIALHTPKTIYFSKALSIVGNNWKRWPIIKSQTFFSPPNPSLTRDPMSTIWVYGGPHQTPPTTIHTPKTIHFTYVSAFVRGPFRLRRFKPLGISLNVNAGWEICKVCIFALIFFFPRFLHHLWHLSAARQCGTVTVTPRWTENWVSYGFLKSLLYPGFPLEDQKSLFPYRW